MGRVLTELEAEGRMSVSGVAALRPLRLTGCRRNEVVTLRWEAVDLDAGELRLRDAKTEARWVAVRRRAGLEDVRIHNLRHSFASRGAGAG